MKSCSSFQLITMYVSFVLLLISTFCEGAYPFTTTPTTSSSSNPVSQLPGTGEPHSKDSNTNVTCLGECAGVPPSSSHPEGSTATSSVPDMLPVPDSSTASSPSDVSSSQSSSSQGSTTSASSSSSEKSTEFTFSTSSTVFTFSTSTVNPEGEDGTNGSEGEGKDVDTTEDTETGADDGNKGLLIALSLVLAVVIILVIFILLAFLLRNMDRKKREKRTEETLEMRTADKDVEIGNVDENVRPDIEITKGNNNGCDSDNGCENTQSASKTDLYSDELVINNVKTKDQKSENDKKSDTS